MPPVQLPLNEQHYPPTPPYPKGQVACRPLMRALLTAKNGEQIQCLVWLDSGADSCCFPLAFAIALKLDVLQLPQANTAGVGSDSNVTYFETINLNLGYGISFDCQVGFTGAMDGEEFGLLGLDGFFSAYDVTISHKQKTFTIEVP